MAKNVLAKLALGLYADTGELGPSLREAGNMVERESRKMGLSVQRVDKDIQKMGQVFKLANTQAAIGLKQTAQAVERVEQQTGKLNKSVGSLSSSFKGLGVAMVGAVGVGSVQQALKLADTYNTLNQRLKTATAATGDYKKVSEELAKISAKNGASFQTTVQLFQNIARSGKELGATNADIIKITNSIQQLGAIGGSSAEEMNNALRQFSQSMAGGVVRAEEFNSIVENMPELAHRIATGLGVTDGQLRKLMLDGKLLSKDVLKVLLEQAPEISAQFEKMPRTMAQAVQSLTDKTGLALAKMDQVTGATKLAVRVLDSLAASIDKIGAAISGLPDDMLGSKFGGVKLGNAINALSAGGFGMKSAGIEADAILGFANPMANPKDVKARLDRRRAELKGQQFAALYGLNDPVFDQLSAQMDGKAPAAVAAAKKPGIDLNAGAAEKAAAKAKKRHDAELKHSEQILANMRSQNEQLRAKLAQDDQALTKEKALLQLSKDKTLTDKEKVKYAAEINKLAAEHAGLIKQQKIAEEKEKLGQILANLKEKGAELKNQLDGQKQLNYLLEAEKSISETVKVGKKETAAEQAKILAAAKEIAALEEQIKRQKIDKAIREDDEKLAEKIQKEKEHLDNIGRSLKEQNEELRLKLSGEDNLIKKLEMERGYQRDITALKREEAEAIREVENNQDYTAEDKTKQIAKIKEGYAGLYSEAEKRLSLARKEGDENIKLNQQLEAQDDLLNNIKDSTGAYKEKLAQLDAAYLKGDITQKQWKKTAEELWKTQAKNTSTFGDSIKQIGQSMTTALLNGTKLNDVFKNMAKSLAALAAQKLVFEPLANGIDNLANKLFGTGKYTQKPVMPGSAGLTAGGGSAGGGLGALLPAAGIAGGGGLLGGFLSSLGIPGFALGGTARGGQIAMFGEEGPELAIPRQDMHIFTAGQTRSILTGAGGGSAGWISGGGGAGGGSAGWISGGGGAVTPESYLGDWVPQHRRELLSSIGFSGAGAEVLSLMQALKEEKNNYNKKALNEQLTNAYFRRAQEWQGLEAEYRELASAANYAGAQKMVDEETAAGRGTGLAAMAGNAILSNNHISHGIIAQGRIVPPRGNAVEDILEAAKLTGRMPSKGLLQHLATLDAEAQDDYMPGHFVTPGAGYKSMGMGFAGQGGKVFDYDDAYGGSGKQAAIQDSFDMLRDYKWATDAETRYWQSIGNTKPVGDYKGASSEYLSNIKGWNKFPKNYGGPGADSFPYGAWDIPGGGMALSNAGYVPTGATGDDNGWIDGEATGSRNPQRFDPTVPSDAYQPKMGNMNGWSQEVRNKPYANEFWPMDSNRPSLQRGYQGSFMDMLKGVASAATAPLAGSANSWKLPRSAYGVPLPRELQNPFSSLGPLPAYPAAMGIATANPKITTAPQPFRGKLSPYADASYREMFINDYGRGSTTYGTSAFSRWKTDPYTAGRIHAQMRFRGAGGDLQAGESAVVGEAGREMITAHRPVHISPNSATAGGGAGNLKIVVETLPGYTFEERKAADGTPTIRMVRKALEAEASRNPIANTGMARARS